MKKRFVKLTLLLLLLNLGVSNALSQRTFTNIEDLTNALKEESMLSIERFDSFYRDNILTRRCSENETMNKWYTERREQLVNAADYAPNLALEFYDNAPDKKLALKILNEDSYDLISNLIEYESSLENLTTMVCNGIPIKIYSIEELTKIIQENNQENVKIYERFLNEEINIYEECRDLEEYDKIRKELQEQGLDWMRDYYENSTNKEESLRILNNMIWIFDNEGKELEIYCENVTKGYCNTARYYEELKKEVSHSYSLFKWTRYLMTSVILIGIFYLIWKFFNKHHGIYFLRKKKEGAI